MTKAPSRKPLISGNWKMHHNHFEALQLVQKLSYLLTEDDHAAVEVSVHPPLSQIRTGAVASIIPHIVVSSSVGRSPSF